MEERQRRQRARGRALRAQRGERARGGDGDGLGEAGGAGGVDDPGGGLGCGGGVAVAEGGAVGEGPEGVHDDGVEDVGAFEHGDGGEGGGQGGADARDGGVEAVLREDGAAVGGFEEVREAGLGEAGGEEEAG